MSLADGYHSVKRMVPTTPCSAPQVGIAGVSMTMAEKFKGPEEEAGLTVINLVGTEQTCNASYVLDVHLSV